MRSLILVALLCAGLPAVAAGKDRVTVRDFSCELPLGWQRVDSSKFAFEALPDEKDGRGFVVVVERKPICPVPREMDEESGFEKGFWKRYDENFEASSHVQITSRDFQSINGVPFRVIHTRRGMASETFYSDVFMTPGSGNLYEILCVRKGGPPEADPALQTMLQSFAFLQPPQLAWYQPWLHDLDEIAGMPLFLAGLGMGIYLFRVRRNPDVPRTRKVNVGTLAWSLLMLNGFWIASLQSWIGVASMLVMGGVILLVRPINDEVIKQMEQGKIPRPSSKRMRLVFWIMIGSCLLGLATADVQMSELPLWIIVVANIGTVMMIGLTFWFKRRTFFPETEAGYESKG